MVPEILIVGDPARRRDLLDHVQALRYEGSFVGARELTRQIREGPAPGAVVMCLEDVDAPLLLASMRRNRQGAAVPVLLHGNFGGEMRDLADVLDLGADGFLEAPLDRAQLRDALLELAGPASGRTETGIEEPPPPSRRGRNGRHDGRTLTVAGRERRGGRDEPRGRGVESRSPPWPDNTERLDGRDQRRGGTETRRVAPRRDVRPTEATGEIDTEQTGAGRPLGSLRDTLDRLEARLRSGDDEGHDLEPGDGIDLSELGLEDIPDVEPEGDELADDHTYSGSGSGSGRGWSEDHSPGRRWDGGARSAREVRNDRGRGEYSRGGEARAERGRDRDSERSGIFRGRRPSRPERARSERTGSDELSARAGQLSPGEVPRLLWRQHQARYSGAIELRQGQGEKTLWMAGGEVVFVRSNLAADRFVDGLLRRGVLTRPQYETARRLAAKEPRRLGRLLVEAGFIKPDEVQSLLREHLARVLQTAYGWEQGSWRLRPGDAVDEAVLLDTPMDQLLLDGLRFELDERQLFQLLVDAFGDRSAKPRLADSDRLRHETADELGDRLGLHDGLRAWLAGLDGRRPLHVLRREPGLDRHETLALLLTLRTMGRLEGGDLAQEVGGGLPPSRDPVQVDADRILDRLRLAREADYFELLGLGRDATRGEVRRAHVELSSTFRDEVLEEGTLDRYARELDELRAALEEARDILTDDAMRSAYLAHLGDPEAEVAEVRE